MHSMKWLKHQKLILVSCVVAVLFGATYYALHLVSAHFLIKQLPPWLSVKKLEYHVSTYEGIGASGHDSSFSVISLSQETAREIESLGADFFIRARRNWNSDPEKEYDEDMTGWEPTPISPTEVWKVREASDGLNLYDFLCQYHICVSVADTHRVQFEQTINKPGSFYSHRGSNYLVINPGTLTVYSVLGR